MDLKEILKKVDHTLLTPSSPQAAYADLCKEGILYNVASICVPPSRVAFCKKQTEGNLAICTVIGFPNGYHDSKAKAYEAEIARENGATEFDMVIDIGRAKEHDYKAILDDIRLVRLVTNDFILKVIIETALLTDEEKISLCEVVNESGADFIKTSTGFASGGATFDDVALLRKYSKPSVRVKAAGGIATIDDAIQFIKLGADRLGTSRIVKIAQQQAGAIETQNLESY